ncbi:MAG: TlyA family RNA methyltransferase [Alphaproteobacteria bacterium]
MSSAKQRLDILLVEKGLAETRSKAQALIMSGLVFSGDKKLDKAGMNFKSDIEIIIKGKEHNWVSRGGLKLEHGLKTFNFDAHGITAIDVGASTGGFTDVLLKNGAEKIYAVDVGYGQLAYSIRENPKVVVLERTNARYLTAEQIPEKVDAVVCDASFISLKTVLPSALSMLKNNGWVIALIKPQFEAGKENIGKKGVVKDPEIHKQVCDDIESWFKSQPNFNVQSITQSPITGPEGNIEFLIGVTFEKK